MSEKEDPRRGGEEPDPAAERRPVGAQRHAERGTAAQAEKIEALRQAIESWAEKPHEQLLDRDKEQALAPVISRAVSLINHRPRSAQELKDRLLDKDYDPDLVEEVIDRCQRNGMLDDAEFARLWVEQRSRNQKKSVAVLRQELKRKGIAQHHIEAALDQVDEEDQDAIMRGLIDKKAASIRAVPADRAEYNKFLKRVVGVAARRGFPQGPSLGYAREALDRRIAELES